ncbi:DegT/DnrJ/EryC1/StrS family aminotransferase [Pseudomonas sessilinigenes]|uniref:DegT/DnrJ/EryC1/StrS family aminotransferase n=1 Tax=Pseudomonas sessilinigenes TaxID=658629 RepID=A0ABX8MJ54_9PSED|nr:DegT/DnrJ/EryC1/StrS family aminotransferase [Pseudomonas sessilinigenes]QXH39350.1 DegT/DnrJ/EryC1/StrS family aminotransferase [Pseudomonas sessilinigenes]
MQGRSPDRLCHGQVQVAQGPADGLWRAREADRLPCSSWLAQFYRRRHGVLLGSGTAALELALRQLGAATTWRVAVPAATCHQVVAAVLNVGAVPVIIENAAELLLSREALAPHVNGLDAVIAVHQYGLPCDIPALRRLLGEQLPIIEDSAGAWDLDRPGASRVITSLGHGKALDIGGGGALFGDTPVDGDIDVWSPGQRARAFPASSPALSIHALPALMPAIARAQARSQRLRQQMPGLLARLRDYGLEPWAVEGSPTLNGQFIPIRTRELPLFERLRYSPHADALGVCAPASAALRELPMLRNRGEVAQGPQTSLELHRNWVLLDPLAALDHPGHLDAWAGDSR